MSKKNLTIIFLLLLTQASLASVLLRRSINASLRFPRSGVNGSTQGAFFSSSYHPSTDSRFWTGAKVLSYLQSKGLSTAGITIVLDGKFITTSPNSKTLFVTGGPLELVQSYYECTLETEINSGGGYVGTAVGLALGLELVEPTNFLLAPLFGAAIGFAVGKGKTQMTPHELSEIALRKAQKHVTEEEVQDYLNYQEP